MKWIVRVLFSAIPTFFIAQALLVVVGLSGSFDAEAAACTSASGQCSQGQAHSECVAAGPEFVAAIPKNRRNPRCEGPKRNSSTLYYYQCLFEYRSNENSPWGSVGSCGDYYYLTDKDCKSQGSYTGTGPWSSGGSARNGSLGCRNGCDGFWTRNADSSMTFTATGDVCPEDEEKQCSFYGNGYYWNAALKVCEPPEGKCGGRPANSLGQCAPEPCPEGKVQQADGTCKEKANECPAGQVKSPDGKCLPGDGQCATGEVRGKDGTCKKDADGDGKPDDGEEGGEGPDGKRKDEFSGGDDCSTPPTCSGSPIMCGQARIQWRIDCNTRKNRNVSGGTCNAMPVCTGDKCDAMEYSALLMQWRSACALEKMAQGSGNGGENGDTKAIRDALTGTGGAVTTAPDRPSSDVWAPRSGTPVKPDTGGYGWGRTCPQPPSFEVFGNVIQINTAPLCNWLILGSYFVMGLAALASLRIIASRDA